MTNSFDVCRLSFRSHGGSRRIVVAHIGEVDERRLYAREACSSMFAYCIEVLHLSEPEAYLRITVARVARKHPMLLVMLGEGRLHLSGIAILAPHLTEENCERVLARAAYKSKRQIEELVAELSPKPDVPVIDKKAADPAIFTAAPAPKPALQLCPGRSSPISEAPPPASEAAEPLAPERYRVQFTASKELRDKLERLEALMQTDLAAVIEAAVTEKLERLEAKRYAETKKPRKSLDEVETAPKSRYIPAPVRRAVLKRDGQRCSFVDRNGRRCTAPRGLEFHHHEPFARGRTRPGDHQSQVSDPQPVRGRAGLRKGLHGRVFGGAFRFSSSNQLTTTSIRFDSGEPSVGAVSRNLWPSGDTANAQ